MNANRMQLSQCLFVLTIVIMQYTESSSKIIRKASENLQNDWKMSIIQDNTLEAEKVREENQEIKESSLADCDIENNQRIRRSAPSVDPQPTNMRSYHELPSSTEQNNQVFSKNNYMDQNDVPSSSNYPNSVTSNRWSNCLILCLIGKCKLCAFTFLQPNIVASNVISPAANTSIQTKKQADRLLTNHGDGLKTTNSRTTSIVPKQTKNMQELCEVILNFDLEVASLSSYCSFLRVFNAMSPAAIPSTTELINMFSSSTDDSLRIAENVVDENEISPKILQLLNWDDTLASETDAKCRRAVSLSKNMAHFHLPCPTWVSTQDEDLCVSLGCCWIGPVESYAAKILKNLNNDSPLLNYFVKRMIKQSHEANHQPGIRCIQAFTDDTLELLLAISIMQENQQIQDQFENPVVTDIATNIAQRNERNGCILESYPRQQCGTAARTKDQCKKMGCCWQPKPNHPSCFLPSDQPL